MIPLVLLGTPGTKRTVYFQKAAARAGVPCLLWEWGQQPPRLPAGSCIKIDPPLWSSCDLGELDDCIRRYQNALQSLTFLAAENDFHFLNRPEAILALLDKRQCKKQLLLADIPTTEPLSPFLENPILDTEQPIEKMASQRLFQVFIKPVYGSGAAGTAAFRLQPGTRRMVLYTCAALEPSSGRLLNTKRLRRLTETSQIYPLLNRILKLGCIAERWYAKAGCQGFSYDLRAVIQDGRLDFLLARLSKGPITNLHLNNHPVPAAALNFSSRLWDSILELCQKAVHCCPGLRSAGIDILLEKGNQKPRIIEMNGQGDLIYQDIYHNNSIYRHQIKLMTKGY